MNHINMIINSKNPQAAFGHLAIQDVIIKAFFTDKRSDAIAGFSTDEFTPIRFETIAFAATAVSSSFAYIAILFFSSD